jgi:hypothetical protein
MTTFRPDTYVRVVGTSPRRNTEVANPHLGVMGVVIGAQLTSRFAPSAAGQLMVQVVLFRAASPIWFYAEELKVLDYRAIRSRRRRIITHRAGRRLI